MVSYAAAAVIVPPPVEPLSEPASPLSGVAGVLPPPLQAASDKAAVAANAVSAKRRFFDTDILGFSPYLSIEAAERDSNIC